ncbi:MAG TPA: glycogen/starch/alpha-glucan phosphorylase [Vicinamibacterales bacterium]|nr:glycogen/starch/alpha-glucan phosphorylase [Vicinamibacterales bacterium]
MIPVSRAAVEREPLGRDRASLREAITHRLVYSVGKDPLAATPRDWLHAAALAVRDRLVEGWMHTSRAQADAKRVYYLSLEFLTGRLLSNSLQNIGLDLALRGALADLEVELDGIQDIEQDAALGNGGLGRLAACILDSMATLSLPGVGYGIRYEYGLFFQTIEQGAQVEHPDTWLRYGNPWEVPRPELLFLVRFGGRTVHSTDPSGRLRVEWVDTHDVFAMAFDTPVPGYNTGTVNNLRLWSARATRDFSLRYFNEGNYFKAVEQKTESENLSKVLYPDDSTLIGRELRLKQQYFFVSASLQDILPQFLEAQEPFDRFPERVAIQLNDTHPAIAIPELMRLLLDVHGLEWDQAWDITRRTFAYTNHTLMPEALEMWPVDLFERVLPRHLRIIYEINHRFLEQVRRAHPGDDARLARMSIVGEEGGRRIRMANLAIVGSHHVNGVSRLHSDLMRQRVFADFHALRPEAFVNITNGVTPRRWLHHANPGLASLITGQIGPDWVSDLGQLTRLAPQAERPEFRARFLDVKRENKQRLKRLIRERTGVDVNEDSMFDVQVKRIHEYKRQLLNVLHVVTRYNRIREGRLDGMVPRTVIISGKAAPGYWFAKLIIRLIHGVADVVNHDPAVGDMLKLVFIPNYNVSNAEWIIPACDLSEQISTAGTEASGTGNMKLALNGALTIGTLDGANIEMRHEVGAANMFIFGKTARQAAECRASGYNPWQVYECNAELRQALDMIAGGVFSPDEPSRFRPVFDRLTAEGDPFLLLADYASYLACQTRVDALYGQPGEWARRAVLNVAGMGVFSSDRTVFEYARLIWDVTPVATPPPGAARRQRR